MRDTDAKVKKSFKNSKHRGLYIKLIVVGVIIALIGSMWIFDSVRASTFNLELISCSPEIAVATGSDGVELTYRLTRNNKPVEGHNIYIYCDGNGRFYSYRETTDENGEVTFLLYPGRATQFTPAKDIPIYASDESNSIFVMVKAEHSFVLPVVGEGEAPHDRS